MNRRDLFANFTRDNPEERERTFKPHPASRGAKRFTNALLRTHEGKEVRFYDDLIYDSDANADGGHSKR